jgi:hypothetical protein
VSCPKRSKPIQKRKHKAENDNNDFIRAAKIVLILNTKVCVNSYWLEKFGIKIENTDPKNYKQ